MALKKRSNRLTKRRYSKKSRIASRKVKRTVKRTSKTVKRGGGKHNRIRKNRRNKRQKRKSRNNKLSIKQLGGFENKILTQVDIIKYGSPPSIVGQFRTRVINTSHSDGAKKNCADLKDFNDMIVHMYGRLSELIRQERQPVTLVSIGNSPYKIVRLLELFSGVKDLQSIYIPFSGKYTSIIDTAATVECSCGTVGMYKRHLAKKTPDAINTRDTGAPFPPDRQTNPRAKLLSTKVDGQMVNLFHWPHCKLLKSQAGIVEELEPSGLAELYRTVPDIHTKQYTPEQLEVFTQIILDSGLFEAVNQKRQIIFVDYLETGMSLVSFLITFEKILSGLVGPVNPRQIKIYGLCRSELNPAPIWVRSPSLFNKQGVSNGLVLKKYPIEYIPLEHIDKNECANIFLNIDEYSNDRCVKSYKKDEWEHTDPFTFKTSDLTKCNITLSYMYHILRNNGLIRE